MISTPLRPSQSLAGLWDFVFLGDVALDAVSPRAVQAWERTPVPAAFDVRPDLAGRRGVALYRTRFSVPSGRRARLEFGAVSLFCRVWIDGVLLKEHANGYAPFTVDAPGGAGEHELVVLADNRFDFARVPMHEEYFDFYQYGGILRDVRLELPPTDGAFIDHVHVLPTAGYADGEVEVRVAVIGADAVCDLEIAFDGGSAEVRRGLPVNAGEVRWVARVPQPRVWSPAKPVLHTATVRLVAGGDALAVRFGLRRIEARAGKLWLNGAELALRGYNRHEWHPNTGPATGVTQMHADLLLMRELGCNFVRGSHYPQDQRFLELCDELGFLVWEENVGWGQKEKTFASDKFLRDHDETLRAMVRASANHPSIIIWGFLNEAVSDRDCVRPCFERSVATLRALDGSRLVSYATMFAMTDRHYDLIDVIALNVYPGWYGCAGSERPLELVAPHWDACFASIDAKGFADKPVIISETGVEALYGWREEHGDFFSEQFQAAYLGLVCALAERHPRCSGLALWHFSDVRTYGRGLSLMRPRTFNNKGTFDEYRRPKLAAAAVRQVWAAG